MSYLIIEFFVLSAHVKTLTIVLLFNKHVLHTKFYVSLGQFVKLSII